MIHSLRSVRWYQKVQKVHFWSRVWSRHKVGWTKCPGKATTNRSVLLWFLGQTVTFIVVFDDVTLLLLSLLFLSNWFLLDESRPTINSPFHIHIIFRETPPWSTHQVKISWSEFLWIPICVFVVGSMSALQKLCLLKDPKKSCCQMKLTSQSILASK